MLILVRMTTFLQKLTRGDVTFPMIHLDLGYVVGKVTIQSDVVEALNFFPCHENKVYY